MHKLNTILLSIKVLIPILFLGVSNLVFGQYDFVDSTAMANPCGWHQSNARPVMPFINNLFCWADYEIETDSIQKIEMFNNLDNPEKLGRYMYYDDYEELYDSSSAFGVGPSNIHVIDYNMDGLPDFVSSLWVYWDKTLYTEFWKNNGHNWEFDSRVEGQIVEMGYDSINSTPWFKTYHSLCCGDYIHWINNFNLNKGKWILSERIAFIGRFPFKNESITFNRSETVILNAGDTLLSFRDRNGVRLKSKELRDYRAIAILKQQVRAKVLYSMDGPLNKRLSFVLLDPDAEFEKSFFRKDHRTRGISLENKKRMKTYYGGWMLDVKRKK